MPGRPEPVIGGAETAVRRVRAFVLLVAATVALAACQDPSTTGGQVVKPRVATWDASTWDESNWE